jgi:cytochrome c553
MNKIPVHHRDRTLRIPRYLIVALLGASLSSAAFAQTQAKPTINVAPDHAAKMAEGMKLFKEHVRPVLTARCVRCHGGKSTEAELNLTDRDGLMRGGSSGPAIVVGNARDSLLYKLITHVREPHMPHNAGKLPPDTVAHFANWIDHGAPYDRPLRGPGETPWWEKKIPESARQFWSFQPLLRQAPPDVKGAAWVRTPIDRFILARLETAGIEPNPPAEKRQLIRRLYFDLIGLPPTPDEVESFVEDACPEAYEKLVDRLLDSPRFGERWGRYWLDLARFAESHGFEQDYDRPSAYHYRDFVIQAMNADLPYDTFVRWQLAGDELEPDDRWALAATGFLAAGVHSTQITKREVEKQRYDELDDMAATVGTAMLAMTIGCARCHDHKFDPIPQADYYSLVSTFTTTVRSEFDFNLDPSGYQAAKQAFDRAHRPYVTALKTFEAERLPSRQAKLDESWSSNPERFQWAVIDGINHAGPRLASLVQWQRTRDPEWLKLNRELQAHLQKAPKPRITKILVASEGLPPIRLHTQGDDFFKKTYFLGRGDPDQKCAAADQGFLQVLTPGPNSKERWPACPPKNSRTSYRRRALADWITDVDHGAGALLARVIVNRLWQHHLGRGIVATPSEFGSRGEKPTHPELLDWLAAELIRNHWQLKPIHRLIVTSAVYMESAATSANNTGVDHANHLFWRRHRARLEAEAIRDALLAVSGNLDQRMFGPGTLRESNRRRSIYFTIKHSGLIPMMQVFDAPDALQGIGERPTTTIAPQALLLLNNPHIRGYAQAMARRIAPNSHMPFQEAVNATYLAALGRPPSDDEYSESVAFLERQAVSYRASGKLNARSLALADFCQAIMCLNEFIYIE